ncbi:hypothetical protein ACFP8W_22645, partial [Nocardioides hankookensis]
MRRLGIAVPLALLTTVLVAAPGHAAPAAEPDKRPTARGFGGAVADPTRDLDWTETVGPASPDFAAVPVKAEDPFLIA